jgi:hypothetical protein
MLKLVREVDNWRKANLDSKVTAIYIQRNPVAILKMAQNLHSMFREYQTVQLMILYTINRQNLLRKIQLLCQKL